MKVLAIIPARGGSKGIPCKNKKPLLGKPLILYTIEAALASMVSRIIVSTDDDEIATIAREAGVEVLMRPAELAADNTPTLPVLQHVVAATGEAFDAVMTLQPTSPLRTARHINDSITLFTQNPEADSLVSVVRVPHNCVPSSLMKLEGGWLQHYDSQGALVRRQDKPVLWARNGAAVYITRMERLDSYIIGGMILPYEMGKAESIDLDEPDDWKIAEALLSI